MKSAVGYTRLSQESGRSIESQKEDIRNYCEGNGLDLKHIFDDGESSSGYDDERSEYQEMKTRLEPGLIDAVVVRDRQRIGRDFDERMRFILDLRELDVELHTTMDGKIDLDDPYSVAVEGIHSASDDKKKREEIRKAKREIRKKQNRGEPLGNSPSGFKYSKDKTELVPNENFFKVLEAILMRDQGYTLQKICDELDAFSPATVSRLHEKREMYESYLEDSFKKENI